MIWPFSLIAKRRLRRLLKAECARLDSLPLPWVLDLGPLNGFYNCRPIHSRIGFTLKVEENNGHSHNQTYDTPARAVAAASMIHPSGRTEWQGPFSVSPAVPFQLVLMTPRHFQPPPADDSWLRDCGIDGGGVGGASGDSDGATVAARTTR